MNEQLLSVLMMEYNALRTESREKQKAQFTIISLIVSSISIVFGLTANLEPNAAEVSLPILYYALLPCTTMFFGILWLDQVYRQVMIGTYIVQIEKKVNSLFHDLNLPSDLSYPMNWEQWLSKRRPTHEFWKKPNYYYTYICSGTFTLLPIVIYFIGGFLTETSPWTIFGILFSLIFLVYIWFGVQYVNEILALDKEIEGNRDK